jgi:hypothetical protein
VFVRTRVSAVNEGSAGAPQAKVMIRATPESAKIFWDEAPLGGNPASAAFTRDGLSHSVRVEAPGFARKTELVVLDSSNVSVEIALDPESKDDVDPFGNKLSSVTIESKPNTARLYLDGVLLPSNPSTAKYPRDGKQHEIKADAPGYLPKSQKITLDKPSSTVTVELTRDFKVAVVPVPPAPRAGHGSSVSAPARHGSGVDRTAPGEPDPTPAPPVTAATPAPVAPAPTTSKPGSKQLDRSDPWGSK